MLTILNCPKGLEVTTRATGYALILGLPGFFLLFGIYASTAQLSTAEM